MNRRAPHPASGARLPPAGDVASECSARSGAHDAMEGKKLHVAPMLAVTDAHFRQLCRLLSRQAVLWTEMVHADAILHNGAHLLPFDAVQQPCVLQLGGSLPETLARAAAIGVAEYGYTEVNLNVRRTPAGKRRSVPCGRGDPARGARGADARGLTRTALCAAPVRLPFEQSVPQARRGAVLRRALDAGAGAHRRVPSVRPRALHRLPLCMRSPVRLLTPAPRRMAEAVDVPVSVKCRVRCQRVSLRASAC